MLAYNKISVIYFRRSRRRDDNRPDVVHKPPRLSNVKNGPTKRTTLASFFDNVFRKQLHGGGGGGVGAY